MRLGTKLLIGAVCIEVLQMLFDAVSCGEVPTVSSGINPVVVNPRSGPCRHEVDPFVRRLPTGQRMSDIKRQTAGSNGFFDLDDGYTWVVRHTRGKD